MKRKLVFISLVFVLIITSGFGCKLQTPEEKAALEPIKLTYWRVWDGPDAFSGIIEKYRALHPNVTIDYKKFRYEEYEDALLEAFAEDRGPDIFSIHNTWMRGYQNKLVPLPASTKMAYQVQKGTIKKEIVTEVRSSKSLTVNDIKNNFVDVVYDDVIIPVYDEDTKKTTEFIYGLPLSVDTLAMYYNKDLLNNAGLPSPPEFWDRDFQQAVKKMTKQDSKGDIIQSGVALGGADNINRFSDILSILMMQSGAEMMDGNTVTFHLIPDALKSQGLNPGQDALRFYADFANPAKEVYSWNNSLENSMDLFLQGKLAMMFGYSYDLPAIKARAPKLNFDISKLPQINSRDKTNFANYWVEVVSRKTGEKDAAWDFLQFATKEEQAKTYLEKTNKPTALRSLIEEQKEDPEIGVFVDQILTSESWYKGKDSNAAEVIFRDMINDVTEKGVESKDAVELAAQRVQQTIR